MWCILQSPSKAPNLYLTPTGRWSEAVADVRLFPSKEAAEQRCEEVKTDPKSGWNRANPLSVVRI